MTRPDEHRGPCAYSPDPERSRERAPLLGIIALTLGALAMLAAMIIPVMGLAVGLAADPEERTYETNR